LSHLRYDITGIFIHSAPCNMKLLKKYWGTFRRQRLLHILNNLIWYPQLLKNRDLYARYGIRKSIVSGVSHKDISAPSREKPWLDAPDAKERLRANPAFLQFSPEIQQELMAWPDQGYLVLPGFVKPELCDQINEELEKAIATKQVEHDYTNSRVMNFYEHSEAVRKVIHSPILSRLLDFMLGKKTLAFQSINFTKGSQQNTHSDSIHMTTEPLGYLLAIWVALEDISMGSGPLHYYPGSHKLPYVMSEDFENDNTFFTIGENYYELYEKKIAETIQKSRIEKKIFLARKGDLLIWHANLLHGGEKVTDPLSTRKSLVAHYFCQGDVVNYHEITQRPAIIKS
jgi:ectoine hydroxylase